MDGTLQANDHQADKCVAGREDGPDFGFPARPPDTASIETKYAHLEAVNLLLLEKVDAAISHADILEHACAEAFSELRTEVDQLTNFCKATDSVLRNIDEKMAQLNDRTSVTRSAVKQLCEEGRSLGEQAKEKIETCSRLEREFDHQLQKMREVQDDEIRRIREVGPQDSEDTSTAEAISPAERSTSRQLPKIRIVSTASRTRPRAQGNDDKSSDSAS